MVTRKKNKKRKGGKRKKEKYMSIHTKGGIALHLLGGPEWPWVKDPSYAGGKCESGMRRMKVLQNTGKGW